MTEDTKFVDGVRHLYVPGLNSISTISDMGFRFWLATGKNYVVQTSAFKNAIELCSYDIISAFEAYVSDISRLSCAAEESVATMSEPLINKKSIAWHLVSYYYSAFYSAHSMLKILGFGLVQLDPRIISQIKTIADIQNVDVSYLSRGVYCVEFDIHRNVFRLYKVSRYDDSHRGLWNRFSDLLGVLLGVEVKTSSCESSCIRTRVKDEATPLSVYSHLSRQDALEVASIIESVRSCLNKNGDCNWLSQCRNNINYSHRFGVWYPYHDAQIDYNVVKSLQPDFYVNPLDKAFSNISNEGDMLQFVHICQLINSMNNALLMDLSLRHPKNQSFVKKRYLKFKKLYIS